MKFEGTPFALSAAFLRRMRLIFWGTGGAGSLILGGLEHWFWAPVPFVVAYLLYDALLSIRRDKPEVLTVEDDEVFFVDASADRRFSLRREELFEATVMHSSRVDGHFDVVVRLSDRLGPRFSVAFVRKSPPEGSVDVEREVPELGAIVGQVVAAAPYSCRSRQRFDWGLVPLLKWASGEAVERTGVRLWQGAEPALSAYGFHEGEADRWLVVGEGHYYLDGEEHLLPTYSLALSERTIRLHWGGEVVEERLAVLRLALGELVVCVPADLAAELDLPQKPALATDYHTHTVEAVLLRHALGVVLPVVNPSTEE